MKSFLGHLAEHLLEKYPNKGVTIVFPNKRASLFLKDEIQQRIKTPQIVPEIIGIEEFISRYSGLNLIHPTDLIFLFYEVYANVKQDEKQPFADFIQWGKILLHDFAEMDQQLAEPKEFFEYLHAIREIDNWGKEEQSELTTLQKNFNNFWFDANTYYQELISVLKARQLTYSGFAERVAHENIVDKKLLDSTNEFFLFAGFNALSAAEEGIFDHLANQGKAELLWDADEYYLNNTKQEAGLFLRRYQKNWSLSDFNWTFNDLSTSNKKLDIIGVSQQSGQVKLTAEFLKIYANESNKSKTAVILADENLLIPMLQSIPTGYDKVNITMGYPLINAPADAFFKAIVKLFIHSKEGSFKTNLLIDLLNHNYTKKLASNSELEAHTSFQDYLISNNVTHTDPVKHADYLENIGTHNGLFSIRKVDELIAYLIKTVEQLRDVFNEDGGFYAKLEKEYLLAYYQIFNRLLVDVQEHDFIDNFRTFDLLFNQTVSSTTVDFKGEPLEGLQIMGMLETRNLDFENLILLSANEGILPIGKSHNSFVPFDVKRKFNLPSFREKDSMFAYHFYRLLQRSKKVHLIYNTETDDFGSGEKSRFVKQVQEEMKELPGIEINDTVAVTKVSVNAVEPMNIVQSPLLVQQLRKLVESGLSPTSLSTYLTCPLDFYYKYILGLSEHEEIEEEIEASSFGSVIHDVLEKMYEPHQGSFLEVSDLKEMQKKAPEIIKALFHEIFDEQNLSHGKNLLSMNVAVNYIDRFLKKELQELEEGRKIKIISTEKKVSKTLGLRDVGLDFDLKLKGKIDRIDEYDGNVRIIDYKTGNATPQELNPESIDDLFTEKYATKSLQLMTYAFLFSNGISNSPLISGIHSFRNSKSGLMPLSLEKNKVIDATQLQEFEQGLKLLVKSMFDEQLSWQHNTNALYCKFCH